MRSGMSRRDVNLLWKMTVATAVLTLASGIGPMRAQQAQAQPGKLGKQPQPVLIDCGAHGGAEILCGTLSPEDLELTPDNKFLIVSQFVNNRGPAPSANSGAAPSGNNGAAQGANNGAGLMVFDIAAKTYSRIPITSEPRKDWGDNACPGPIGDALIPHGISLGKRGGGAMQLLWSIMEGANRSRCTN